MSPYGFLINTLMLVKALEEEMSTKMLLNGIEVHDGPARPYLGALSENGK